MNMILPPELKHWIQSQVNKGTYQSETELVIEAIRALQQQEQVNTLKKEELQKELNIGIQALENGQSTQFTKDVIEKLKKKGKEGIQVKQA